MRQEHRPFPAGRTAKLAHIGAFVPDRKAEVGRCSALGGPLLNEDIGGEDVRTAMADLRGNSGFLLEILERIV